MRDERRCCANACVLELRVPISECAVGLPFWLQKELVPMRWVLAAAIIPFALAAHADTVPPGLTGNDVGGIIQWTPDVKYFYRDLAAYHCGRYNKIAVISSVHRRYGDYVGFRCYFPRDYDPRKAFLYGVY
jgi:hypothetical protein